jgi:hypothetical protein
MWSIANPVKGQSKRSHLRHSSTGILALICALLLVGCFAGQPTPNKNLSNTNTSRSEEEDKAIGEALAEKFMNDPEVAESFGMLPVRYFRYIENSGGQSAESISNNIRAIDPALTYEHLTKDIERYEGQAWGFNGRILLITESKSTTGGRHTQALVGARGSQDKPVYVRAIFATDFLDGQSVYVVGYIAGRYRHTLPNGAEVFFPALAARAILKPGDVARYK